MVRSPVPAITTATMDMSLIRMFNDGPLVSLNGSPIVSPITRGVSLITLGGTFDVILLDGFLGIVPSTTSVGHEQRHQHPCHQRSCQHATKGIRSEDHTHDDGSGDSDDARTDHLPKSGLR